MSDEVPMAEDGAVGTVGGLLSRARAAQGLSLAEVANTTRIPIRYLKTIESGDYADLPSPTYSAGFVKSYARLLGLDGQELSDAFRAETGQAAHVHLPASYEPADPARTPPKWLALLALLVAVVGGLAYLYWRGVSEQPVELAATGSDRPPAPIASAPPPAPIDQPPAAPSTAAPSPAASADGGAVVIAADKDVWIKVGERDGATLFMGVLKQGDRFAVPPTSLDPVLTTGRPGVTRVTVGDAAVPMLGDPDRAAKNISLKPDALRARIGGTGPAYPALPAPGQDNAAAPR